VEGFVSQNYPVTILFPREFDRIKHTSAPGFEARDPVEPDFNSSLESENMDEIHTPGLSKQQVFETDEVLWHDVWPLVEQPEEMLVLRPKRLISPTGESRAIAAAAETKPTKTMVLRISGTQKV
jgi:hypothetical protein